MEGELSMIDQKDTTPRHAAVDGPTLPGITVVVPHSGGRRYLVDPDEQPTQALSQVEDEPGFLDGFAESAVEHTAELEALAAEKATLGTKLLAKSNAVDWTWYRLVMFFRALVDVVAVRFENAGQIVIDHAWVLAKILVASIAALVFAGVGIAWWLS